MKWAQKFLLAVIFLFMLLPLSVASTPISITKGMVITKSVIIKKQIYSLNGSDSLNTSIIYIEGNNITVDFNSAILKGSNDKEFPNQFYGVAIYIKGNNIVLKNASISGYKVAVMADGCNNLVIKNTDFSYNYRQQLQSNWLNEDLSDWMSYHHNENNEWLRYGAGIYLKDCTNATIQNNSITNGQCGLMMVRCTNGLVTDNDFSFNSGIGIGLYRSSNNSILRNKLDFNVRGFSFGFYFRGQDSAGLLLFEQCNNNIIAYNSATHSGDGFFLWAGQSTMDSGAGGCNNNFIFNNDFSYAPTNGIEVTFSKNNIINNIIKECDNGIWGGYSWETNIIGNQFYKNNTAIAIEHGQHIYITKNNFIDDVKDGIKLWARKTQPADWGYAKQRNTTSMNYRIMENSFSGENNAINILRTNNIMFANNNFLNCKTKIKTDSTVTDIQYNDDTAAVLSIHIPEIIKNFNNKSIPITTFKKGRNQIRITDWGPYNFNYPIIFLNKIENNGVYYFEILGPTGSFKIKNSKGLNNISVSEGKFPSKITAQKIGSDVQLVMEYKGPAFTDQFGKQHAAGSAYQFSFRDFDPELNWNVNWYSWDSAHNPNINYKVFIKLFNSKPLKTEETKQLNYTWWGEIDKHLPADSFTTVATTNIDLPSGIYEIGVTADDLVKVMVDENTVIDFWDAAKYKYDEDAHHRAVLKLSGKHSIRVEHVENSGYATLIFKIKPLEKL